MSPAIRLGDQGGDERQAPPPPAPRLDRARLELDGVATRMIRTRGHGAPAVLLHGWLDNAETWLAVLERLAAIDRAAIAYDQPGFGVAPPLGPGNVLDQLADFAEEAVIQAAAQTKRKVVVVGNSLGGWVALRLAERRDLPIAGVVPIGPAGIRMAPLFFSADRIPAVSQIIGLPAPVPPAVTRRVVGRLYRALAFGDPGLDRPGGRGPLHALQRRAPGDPRADRLREADQARPREPLRRRRDRGARHGHLGRPRPPLRPRRRPHPGRHAPPREDRDAGGHRPHAAGRSAGRGRRRDRGAGREA